MIRTLHTIWKKLPRNLRKKIIVNYGASLAKHILKNRYYKDGPITIAGLLRSTTGLGQGARLSLHALQQSGMDVRYKDVGQWFHWLKTIDVELGQESEAAQGGTMVIHLNPVELAIALILTGREFLKYKRVIGYWAWELAYIPEEWRRGVHLVDEIWVPSQFVADAIMTFTSKNVVVVPHPVIKPEISSLTRTDFGIPADIFTVLMMFDLRSCASRKNPFDAIIAFRRAFGNRGDVCLIIKISTPDESSEVMHDIEGLIQGSSNIRLFYDVLSPKSIASLINSIDVLISLHRSEGFGLALAEAMALGKPVIATGYSGNMDFMNHENSMLIDYKLIPVYDPQGIYNYPNAKWAQPEVDQAATKLKQLKYDKELMLRLGGNAQMSIKEQFDIYKYSNIIKSGLNMGACEIKKGSQ